MEEFLIIAVLPYWEGSVTNFWNLLMWQGQLLLKLIHSIMIDGGACIDSRGGLEFH